jgi:hypothetical protein
MLSVFKRKPVAEYERRGYRRDPIVAAACIVFANGRRIECVTVNLSRSGAKLALPGLHLLPQEFELLVPERHIRRNVRLVWRDKDAIGVTFL